MNISGTATKDKSTRPAAATVSPRRGTGPVRRWRRYDAEATRNVYRIGAPIHLEMEPYAVRTLEEVGKVLGTTKQMAHFYVCCALGKLALRLRKQCN